MPPASDQNSGESPRQVFVTPLPTGGGQSGGSADTGLDLGYRSQRDRIKPHLRKLKDNDVLRAMSKGIASAVPVELRDHAPSILQDLAEAEHTRRVKRKALIAAWILAAAGWIVALLEHFLGSP